MNRNRLSKTIETALNAQMTNEAHASQIYLSYAAWVDSQGYKGTANFLFRHAEEERNHMTKILEYILQRGGTATITAIAAPHEAPTSLNNCFEKILEHEIANTTEIYKIVKMSNTEEDWATFNFMQWFVKEQIEEETLAIALLDKVKIAGGDKMSSNALYELDRDLEHTIADNKPAQEATAINP